MAKHLDEHLLPADSVRHPLDNSALRFDTVLRYLDGDSARHIVMVKDACRNEAVVVGPGATGHDAAGLP